MPRIFNLTDIFELVVGQLNDGSFSSENFVNHLDERMLHVLSAFGNKRQAAFKQFLNSA